MLLIIILSIVTASFAYASFDVNLHSPENGIYKSTNSVMFNFSVIGNYSSYNCSIFTNRTGAWMINLTNSSVSNDTFSFFDLQELDEGEFLWNIFCENQTESNFSISNYSLNIDTIFPSWTDYSTYPADNQNYTPDTSHEFNITWSDINLRYVWIEHNFTGTLLNYTSVSNISESIFYYQYGSLKAGSYLWRMFANDTAGNLNFSDSFTYFIQKTESLINLTINETTTNFSISEGNYLNITGTKLSGEGDITLYNNGTAVNSDPSLVSNISFFYIPGTFNITLFYTESENYTESYYTFWVTVNDTAAPSWYDNLTSIASGFAYSQLLRQFNVSWNDSTLDTVWIEHNFSGTLSNYSVTGNINNIIYYYDSPTITPGEYSWSMCANDSQQNLNCTPYFSYSVIKANPSINLTINGNGNLSTYVVESVNLTGFVLDGDDILELYVEGILYNNGSDAVTNITSFITEGIKNITLIYPVSQNYTGTSETLWVDVIGTFFTSLPDILPAAINNQTNMVCSFEEDGASNNITTWYRNNVSDLRIYMPFETNEGSESNQTIDYSGFGNNGVVVNATWSASSGKIGGGYTFNGTDDYITVAHSDSLNLTKQLTVEAWVKREGIGTEQVILSKMSSVFGTDMFSLSFYSNNKVRLTIGAGSSCEIDSISAITDSNWYHIAATYDGDTKLAKIYINGTLDKNDTSCLISSFIWTSDPLGIGALHDGSNKFNGSLDEMRLYNKTLSDAQIKEHSLLNYHHLNANETNSNEYWKCSVLLVNDTKLGRHYNSTAKYIKEYDAVNLTVNGTDGNIGIERDSSINITGVLISGEGELAIYIDGNLINNGSLHISNITLFNETGSHNITLISSGSDTYLPASETHWVTVTDTVNPVISSVANISVTWSTYNIIWNTDEPANSIVFYGNSSGNYTSSASNLTEYTLSHNITISNLEDNRTYYYIVNSTDPSGNSNQSEEYNITIEYQDEVAPISGNELVYPETGNIYNTSIEYFFNASFTDDVNVTRVWIEHNFTKGAMQNSSVSNQGNEYYYNTTQLAAGHYGWRMYANDSSGNIGSTDSFTYVVEQATPSINLTLNRTAGNNSLSENSVVNLTAILLAGETNIILYNNNSIIASGSTIVSANTEYDKPGLYNISAAYPATENYSASMTTYWLTVTDVPEAPTILNLTDDVTKTFIKKDETITFSAYWLDDDTGDSVKLLISRNPYFEGCDYDNTSSCVTYSTADTTSPATATLVNTLNENLTWYGQICDSYNNCTKVHTYNDNDDSEVNINYTAGWVNVNYAFDGNLGAPQAYTTSTSFTEILFNYSVPNNITQGWMNYKIEIITALSNGTLFCNNGTEWINLKSWQDTSLTEESNTTIDPTCYDGKSYIDFNLSAKVTGLGYFRVYELQPVWNKTEVYTESFIADSTLPATIIFGPTDNETINLSAVDFNYSVNDSFIDRAWYQLDYSTTKNFLDPALNTTSISFDHPGQHIIILYANDSAGNINSTSTTFYSNAAINLTKWKEDMQNSNPEISNILISNSTGQADELADPDQDFTILLQLTDVNATIVNFSGSIARWNYVFNITDASSDFESQVDSSIATLPVDFAYLQNFSWFYSSENTYHGIVRLPKNISQYDSIYYCPDHDLSNCYIVTSVCTGLSDSDSTPCYNNSIDYIDVFVPHFSGVFGDNDTVAPTISISSPVASEVLSNGYDNYLTLTVNENSFCYYKFSTDPSYTIFSASAGTSFQKRFNSENDAWVDASHTFNILCNDTYGNSNTDSVSFTVNDTTAPTITSSSFYEESASAEIDITTNEPTQCRYNQSNVAFSLMTAYVQNASYIFVHSDTVDTEGMHYIKCQDMGGNEVATSMDIDFTSTTNLRNDDDEGNTGGAGGDSETAGPSSITRLWQSMPTGTQTMTISSEELIITKLTFSVLEDITKTVSITVSQVISLSSSMPELDNLLYKYARITTGNLPDSIIENVKIRFKVKDSWIKENNIDISSIKLNRYTGKWDLLPTSLTDTDSKYFYFEATSPGFSYFGVNAKAKPTSPASTPAAQNDTNPVPVMDSGPQITGSTVTNQTSIDKKDLIEKIIENPLNYLWPVFTLLIIFILVIFLIYQNRFSVVTDSDLVGLRKYVQTCESEGIEFEKIKDTLVNAGWKESLVELVLHDVHMPHDEIEKLEFYISYATNKGIKPEEIKENLLGVGWQHDIVDELIKKIKP
ncbi:MAG: PGF-pre-PGF domain-containing protein [Nanoarchaeota archaeon]|nr:PGF-pre-PGF domain-containing protein [Nanoarchaeota archaeon]